jgi:hypothetical protein
MDQLQKAGGPATSVGIDQNRARVRLFLMTPNVSCRSAVKATAVARSQHHCRFGAVPLERPLIPITPKTGPAAAKSGFETGIQLPADGKYVAVQALDASGKVLAVSKTLKR